jgi:hypothetical protein
MSFKVVHAPYPFTHRHAGATLLLHKPAGQLDGVAIRVSVVTGDFGEVPLRRVNAGFEPLWREAAYDLRPADLQRAPKVAVEARFFVEQPPDATGAVSLSGSLVLPGEEFVDGEVEVALNAGETSASAGILWWIDA